MDIDYGKLTMIKLHAAAVFQKLFISDLTALYYLSKVQIKVFGIYIKCALAMMFFLNMLMIEK